MRIELNCAECGENRFDSTKAVDGDAVVCCDACGHKIGTLAELKERVAADVMKRAGPPQNLN